MTKRAMRAAMVLGAAVATGVAGVDAQDVEEARPRARALPRVEAIMQMRERLELTGQQIEQLDGIRREIVAQRSAERGELDEMRSRLAAGQIRRSELMAFMEQRRDAREGVAEQSRERIEAVLTEDQIASLAELRVRAAFARGRASAMRGDRSGLRGRPGMRGRRNFRDGRS